MREMREDKANTPKPTSEFSDTEEEELKRLATPSVSNINLTK